MGIDFTAVDFETANHNRASVCAVGAVKVRSGKIVDRLALLVRPPDGFADFHPLHQALHGLEPADVEGAARWPAAYAQLTRFSGPDLLVAHNAPYDRSILFHSCSAYDIDWPDLDFLCSLKLSRALLTLPVYSLSWVGHHLGLDMPAGAPGVPVGAPGRGAALVPAGASAGQAAGQGESVDGSAGRGPVDGTDTPAALRRRRFTALENAEASAAITLALAERSRLVSSADLMSIGASVRRGSSMAPRDWASLGEVEESGLAVPDFNSLHGEKVAFTGQLTCMTREEAMHAVCTLGGEPLGEVTPDTTLLVVGGMHMEGLVPGVEHSEAAPAGLSDKLRCAQKLIDEGHRIEIVPEDMFLGRIDMQRETEHSAHAARVASTAHPAPDYVLSQGREVPRDAPYPEFLRRALAHPEGASESDVPCVWCGKPVHPHEFTLYRERRVCGAECNERLKCAAKRAWHRYRVHGF
ncbi:hypothetical protein [Brevibacterium samyangense]|uniref:Exonuclease domain-containing protein n=1 Tax=Brevibacterium samyangense TaxID=366888 RepID=A0ABN2TEC4_9MICO